MQLVKDPNDALSKECLEIEASEMHQYEDIASEMIGIMTRSDGAGLAAPQVSMDKKLVVFFSPISEEGPSNSVATINPEIIDLPGELDIAIEG